MSAVAVQAPVERDPLWCENARLRGDLHTVASRICHDLRTPLSAILAAADALRDEAGQNAPAQAPLWDSLFVSADELQHLIERVSFITKASSVPRLKGYLPMSNAVFAALTNLESRILNQGAVVVQPVAWPDVFGVGPWLETIWWNLISNALIHAGGPIRIELGWREDAVQLFWVRDNGPGVDRNQRASLFHRFDRLHSPDAPKGLGGRLIPSTLAKHVFATVHPSSILRTPDDKMRHREMNRFVKELRKVAHY